MITNNAQKNILNFSVTFPQSYENIYQLKIHSDNE